MSAAYTLDTSTLRWSGPARSTLIGCPPAPGAQDHWLAGFLQAGAAASLTGDELSLSSSPTTMRLQAQ